MKNSLSTVFTKFSFIALTFSLLLPGKAFASPPLDCSAKDTAGNAMNLLPESTFTFKTADGKYIFTVMPDGEADGDCSFELDSADGSVLATDSLFTSHSGGATICSGDSMDYLNVVTDGQKLQSLSCRFPR